MKYNLKGRGIFVFSDPGGANGVLAIVDMLVEDNLLPKKDFLVFTNSNGIFPRSYNQIIHDEDLDENAIEKAISDFSPDYVFSATSTNDYENKWRKVAKNKKVKTYSFIDHWGNYYSRFSFNYETILPDEIWVINERAKEDAILEGIPAERICVSGNPYYRKVKAFIPQISKNEFFERIGLESIRKTILFISDNIKDSFPKNVTGECILGYDEFTVLNDILQALNRLNVNWNDFQLIIKIHPRSEIKEYIDIVKNVPRKLKYIVVRDCDPLTLNYYSDFVLGMFSNMLIESLLMNKKVLRIQTGQVGEDYLKFDLVNFLLVTSKDQLDINLVNFF